MHWNLTWQLSQRWWIAEESTRLWKENSVRAWDRQRFCYAEIVVAAALLRAQLANRA
jgi:hypothetical protein